MATPITDGAALVRALKKTGTGESKLVMCRKVLVLAQSEDRRASCDEVIEALEDGQAPELTVKKAKALAADGEWNDLAGTHTANIEDLLGDEGTPPVAMTTAELKLLPGEIETAHPLVGHLDDRAKSDMPPETLEPPAEELERLRQLEREQKRERLRQQNPTVEPELTPFQKREQDRQRAVELERGEERTQSPEADRENRTPTAEEIEFENELRQENERAENERKSFGLKGI